MFKSSLILFTITAFIIFSNSAKSQALKLYDGGSAHVFLTTGGCILVYGRSQADFDAMLVKLPDGQPVFVAPSRKISMNNFPVILALYSKYRDTQIEFLGKTLISPDRPTWYTALVTTDFMDFLSEMVATDGIVTIEVKGNDGRPIEVIDFGAVLSSASEARSSFARCTPHPT